MNLRDSADAKEFFEELELPGEGKQTKSARTPKRFGSQKHLVRRCTPPTGLSDFDKGVVNVGNSNDPPDAQAQRTGEAARVEQ